MGSNSKTYDSSFFTATRARNNRQTVSTIPKLCRRICEISQREDVHGSDFGADILRVKRAGGGGQMSDTAATRSFSGFFEADRGPTRAGWRSVEGVVVDAQGTVDRTST